ncbi:MAG: type II toxin-antitoxin system RelB/DinJ family antitoxin [Cystobacterineae bacterium]|nr:type II toxin-antitoxin system RelB/DinJ family antitoxin [Cystobacterineae bacterium]
MKAQSDVRVTIRIEKGLKERAETLFERLGMNMTTALNVFLRKAVDESAIPFSVSAKNAGFGTGHLPAEVSSAFQAAVQSQLEENQRQKLPTAHYDPEKQQAYLEFADGLREYIHRP